MSNFTKSTYDEIEATPKTIVKAIVVCHVLWMIIIIGLFIAYSTYASHESSVCYDFFDKNTSAIKYFGSSISCAFTIAILSITTPIFTALSVNVDNLENEKKKDIIILSLGLTVPRFAFFTILGPGLVIVACMLLAMAGYLGYLCCQSCCTNINEAKNVTMHHVKYRCGACWSCVMLWCKGCYDGCTYRYFYS